MRILRDKAGVGYVIRRRKGQTFAAAFPADLEERQIRARVLQGAAAFFPFDPQTMRFDWGKGKSKPNHFTK